MSVSDESSASDGCLGHSPTFWISLERLVQEIWLTLVAFTKVGVGSLEKDIQNPVPAC
jgi:hypothetical protein